MRYRRHVSTLLMPALVAALGAVNGASGAVVDITAFGADGSDEIDDTAAITSAVAALQPNDTLLIPESSLYFKVAPTANFALDDPGVKVMVRGHVLMTGTSSTDNHLFIVTADRVAFIGEGGVLEGNGSYYVVSDLDDTALIRFYAVKGCSVEGLRLRNAPRFWIWLLASQNCAIRNCVLEGGPVSYSIQSQGIFFRGASNLLIQGNRFLPGADGGKAGSWIGSSSTSSNYRISILDNLFAGAHDHAVYCSGIFHSIIANNIGKDTGGTILKTIGTDNVVANNNLYNAVTGGIEIRNSSRCVVANNLVEDFGFVAVEVTTYGGGLGSYTDNLISGNTLLAGSTNATIYEAVRILASVNASRNKIAGNLIVGAGGSGGNAAISVTSGAPCNGVTITGNTLDQCPGNGILINNVNGSIVSDNIVRTLPPFQSFQQLNVTQTNLVTDNIF